MKNKLSQQILKLRETNHMSQEDLAAELNITRQQVSKWENNDSEPDIDKLIQLCKIFDVDLDELITGVRLEPKRTHLNEDAKRSNRHAPQNFWEFATWFWWLPLAIIGALSSLLH